MSLLDTFFGGDVPPLMALGVVAGSYVLGCFATGYYLVRQRTGQDIRELGSRSTGRATPAGAWGGTVLADDGRGHGQGGPGGVAGVGVDGQRPGGAVGLAGGGGGACLAGAVGFPRREGGFDFVDGFVGL